MGDVVSLVEKASQDLDEEKIKKAENELKQGVFTMDAYLSQLRQMKKMGGMEGVMSMLPGVNKMKAQMENSDINEKMLQENEAIILSMTKIEKNNPKIISGSRRKRISIGSGVDVSKINKLLKQFRMMSDMMKKMSKGKKIPSGAIPDEILNQLK
jgi:signal recognition particle subunit SRP54